MEKYFVFNGQITGMWTVPYMKENNPDSLYIVNVGQNGFEESYIFSPSNEKDFDLLKGAKVFDSTRKGERPQFRFHVVEEKGRKVIKTIDLLATEGHAQRVIDRFGHQDIEEIVGATPGKQ